ncbi:MAG TPA: phosphoribosylformylglycinamidine synthase subunit PurQ [Acidimicrobiales bacterium]|nr:phosphoribosylformylglycinamidine synthase subunit PurQ [Acidimicrobiales bacterium]
MTARIGVVVFPGTNCEHDVVGALDLAASQWAASHGGPVPASAELVWHGEHSLAGCDAVVLPGGFAHGDYLRPGAIARFSPVMEAVAAFAAEGGPVVGICNGFQVLTEAGLLPGALQKNRDLRFLCTAVDIEVCTTRSVLSSSATAGARLSIPINHFEGNYTCDAETLARLRDEDRIVFRYAANPNGSVDDIAGVCNTEGNVVGLMPHPERASDPLLGSEDGLPLLTSLVASAASRVAQPA